LLVFPVVYMLSRYPSDECADCGALHWANLLVFRDNLQCTPKTGLWICNKSVVYVLLCHPSDEGALCAALLRVNLQSFPEVDLQ